MRCHTYYQPVAGMPDASRLIDLWAESWQKNGWETEVLNESVAKSHPGYSYFVERIRKFPSVNNWQYEKACYLRHLAMAYVEGAVLTDYDVINRDFKPDHLQHCFQQFETKGWPVFLEPTLCPCAIYCQEPESWENLCDSICEFDPKGCMHNGRPHVSDQTIIRSIGLGKCIAPFCVEHLCSGEPIKDDPGEHWRQARMIHFSNHSFGKLGLKGDKVELIKRVLQKLPPV